MWCNHDNIHLISPKTKQLFFSVAVRRRFLVCIGINGIHKVYLWWNSSELPWSNTDCIITHLTIWYSDQMMQDAVHLLIFFTFVVTTYPVLAFSMACLLKKKQQKQSCHPLLMTVLRGTVILGKKKTLTQIPESADFSELYLKEVRLFSFTKRPFSLAECQALVLHWSSPFNSLPSYMRVRERGCFQVPTQDPSLEFITSNLCPDLGPCPLPQ